MTDLNGPNSDWRNQPGGSRRLRPVRHWEPAFQHTTAPVLYDEFHEEPPLFVDHGPDDPRSRTLSHILRVLWRRKAIISVAMLVCGVLAFVISLMLTPRYMSEGIVAIETRPLYMPQLGSQMPPLAIDPTIPRTEAQILKSRGLLEAVARQLGLDKDPDLNPFLRDSPLFMRIVDSVRFGIIDAVDALGLVAKGRGGHGDRSARVWEAVVDNMARRLDILNDGKSYVIYVNFDSDDPQTSAAVVNTLMKNFIANQGKAADDAMVTANSWIKRRAEELRKDVEDSDAKVEAYRSSHSLVETKGGTVSSQQLNEINTQLSLARADRAQAEANYAHAQEEASGATHGDAATEVLTSNLIQRLREREAALMERDADLSTRLGPQHPLRRATEKELRDLRGQINREIAKILRSLKNQAQIAAAREQQLEAQLHSLQARATSSSAFEVQLNQLQKEADTKRNVYQTFLATAQQTAEPSRVGETNARIVSNAITPTEPSSPRKKLFVFGGVFMGLLVSSAASLLLAEMEPGFGSAADVEVGLGVRVLGALPLARRTSRRSKGLGDDVLDNPNSAACETLRGMRVALRTRGGRGMPQVVLVTSSEPGEGKTWLATALGAVAARDGIRTLIVDSDLRRPRIHRMFRAAPGAALQDVLRGRQDWSIAVRTDEVSGADCLTANERTDSPASLLMSGHWNQFLKEARKVYELIILDSPPIIQVADALTLAEHADATIFVIGHRQATKEVVQEALRRFATTGKRIAGAVLTKVSGGLASQPYYSGYSI